MRITSASYLSRINLVSISNNGNGWKQGAGAHKLSNETEVVGGLTVGSPLRTSNHPVRRPHLSSGQPCSAGPRAAEAGAKRAPKDPLGLVPGMVPGVLALGHLRGPFCQFQVQPYRAVRLIGELFYRSILLEPQATRYVPQIFASAHITNIVPNIVPISSQACKYSTSGVSSQHVARGSVQKGFPCSLGEIATNAIIPWLWHGNSLVLGANYPWSNDVLG